MPSLISQMRSGITPQQQTQAAISQMPQLNSAYLNQIKTMMRSKNPTQLLTNMAAQNPAFAQIVRMMSGQNANPQQMFETLARQRGIDPNWLLQQLQN